MVVVLDELDSGFELLRPEDAPAIMSGYEGEWWIAGGWAMDLVAGRQTRDHADLDIGTYRDEVPLLFSGLTGVELHAADGGRLIGMDGPGDLPGSSNSIWARRSGNDTWLLEFILNDSEGDAWVYRRDPRIRLPRDAMVLFVDDIPCIKPEIQLLFKAKHMRERDIADFEVHSPRLHPNSRAWLADALTLVHPGHPWIGRL